MTPATRHICQHSFSQHTKPPYIDVYRLAQNRRIEAELNKAFRSLRSHEDAPGRNIRASMKVTACPISTTRGPASSQPSQPPRAEA